MKNLNTTYVLIISFALGLALFIGLIFFIRQNKPVEEVVLPVVLEEFSDFECPACNAFYDIVETVIAEYDEDELEFRYRHFPLTTIHENAYGAAVASEAAREQGKFDEYAALLFENQNELGESMFYKIAMDLNLDMEKFENDLDNEAVIARVELDMEEADKRRYNSTPTFVLNGKRLTISSNPESELRDAIQQKIDQAKSQAENN